MAASQSIGDFFVSLGFRVDSHSAQRWERTIERSTQSVTSLALAATAAAAAVTAATIGIAKSFEELYYASDRTGASAANLRSFSYAVSQLGGSYATAMGSMEAFTRNIRSNRGYESLIVSLGVKTRDAQGNFLDTVEVMKRVGEELAKKPYDIAKAYSDKLGIDENTIRVMRFQKEALEAYEQQYKKTAASIGLDTDKAAEASKNLNQTMRSFWMTLTVLVDKLLLELTPAIEALVKQIDDWIKSHPEEITAFFQGLTDVIRDLTHWILSPDGLVAAMDRVKTIVMGVVDAIKLLNEALSYSGLQLLGKILGSNFSFNTGITGGTPSINDGGLFSGITGFFGRAGSAIGGALGITPAHGSTSPSVVSTGTAPGHVASQAERAEFIRKEAIARGIDPNVALRIAQKEGFNKFGGDPDINGNPTSFGDFQLHYPGVGRNTADGLGTKFTRETGLDARDPKNWKQANRFALDEAARGGWGPWHGRIPAGIGERDGLAGAKPMGWRSGPGDEAAPTARTMADALVDGFRRISSGVGMRVHPITGVTRMHKGTDLAAPAGSAFRSQQDGQVTGIDGNGDVTIKYGDGTTGVYRHGNPSVNVGDDVKKGQALGSLKAHDHRSTGPHLHYETYDKDGNLYDPNIGKNDFTRQPTPPSTSLAADVSNDNSKSLNLNNKTEIHVAGGGNPMETANAVSAEQNKVNSLTLRNAQSAIR